MWLRCSLMLQDIWILSSTSVAEWANKHMENKERGFNTRVRVHRTSDLICHWNKGLEVLSTLKEMYPLGFGGYFFFQNAACGNWVTDMPVIQRRVLHPCCEAEWQYYTVIKGNKEASVLVLLCFIFCKYKQWQKKTRTSGNLEFLLQFSEWNESKWKIFRCKLAGFCQSNFWKLIRSRRA